MAVRIDLDFFTAAAREVGNKAAIDTVVDTTRAVERSSLLGVPTDTGQLRSSSVHNIERFPGRPVGTVAYTADHAAAVHEGSRPHIIRPRKIRGVLAFRVNGRLVYARKVRHPGYRGDPWLFRGLLRAAGVRGYRVSRR